MLTTPPVQTPEVSDSRKLVAQIRLNKKKLNVQIETGSQGGSPTNSLSRRALASPANKSGGSSPSSASSASSAGELNWQALPKGFDLSQAGPPLRMARHGSVVDESTVDQNSYIKLGKDQREAQCSITVKNGKIMHNENPLSTDGPMNFVLLDTGKIYIANSVNEQIFHSSLVQDDEDVCAAGTLKAVDGELTYMDENSGHYKPYNRVGYAAARLRDMGCDTSQLTVQISRRAPISDDERSPSTSKERLSKLAAILTKKGQSQTGSAPASPTATSTPRFSRTKEETKDNRFLPSPKLVQLKNPKLAAIQQQQKPPEPQ